MKHLKYAHSFEVVNELPEALRALHKLAFNFRWTWDQGLRGCFRRGQGGLGGLRAQSGRAASPADPRPDAQADGRLGLHGPAQALLRLPGSLHGRKRPGSTKNTQESGKTRSSPTSARSSGQRVPADLFRRPGRARGDHLKAPATLGCPWSALDYSMPGATSASFLARMGGSRSITRSTTSTNCRFI